MPCAYIAIGQVNRHTDVLAWCIQVYGCIDFELYGYMDVLTLMFTGTYRKPVAIGIRYDLMYTRYIYRYISIHPYACWLRTSNHVSCHSQHTFCEWSEGHGMIEWHDWHVTWFDALVMSLMWLMSLTTHVLWETWGTWQDWVTWVTWVTSATRVQERAYDIC